MSEQWETQQEVNQKTTTRVRYTLSSRTPLLIEKSLDGGMYLVVMLGADFSVLQWFYSGAPPCS